MAPFFMDNDMTDIAECIKVLEEGLNQYKAGDMKAAMLFFDKGTSNFRQVLYGMEKQLSQRENAEITKIWDSEMESIVMELASCTDEKSLKEYFARTPDIDTINAGIVKLEDAAVKYGNKAYFESAKLMVDGAMEIRRQAHYIRD